MRRFSLAAMGGSTPVSSTVFIINENCEGTGTPASWSNLNGSPNWDYTTTPLADAQSLFMSVSSASTRAVIDFTNISEAWFYCLFRITGAGTTLGTPVFMGLGPNGGANTYQFKIGATHNMGHSSFTVSTLSLDTTYHVWCHALKGTGANAVLDIGFSTTGVRPTSGNAFVQVTNSSATANIGRLFIGSTDSNVGVDYIYDNIRVAATQIGDNGT